MERRVFLGLTLAAPLMSYTSLVGSTTQPDPQLLVDYMPKGTRPSYDVSGFPSDLFWKMAATGQWVEIRADQGRLSSDAALHISVNELEIKLYRWLHHEANQKDLHILFIQDVQHAPGSEVMVTAGLLRIPGGSEEVYEQARVTLLASIFNRLKKTVEIGVTP